MLFGLSLGLGVAAAVYLRDGRMSASPPAVTVSAPVPEVRVESVPEADEPPPHPVSRFDFYERLPEFEVVIPETEFQARADHIETPLEEPGRYVLQAGSFSAQADAEQMRANLALLGIESRIQKVAIDADEYHRVRIGPTSDLDALNGVRARLWDAEIEVLLIELPD